MKNRKPSAEWQNGLQHLLAVIDLSQDYTKSLAPCSSEISGIWSASLFLRSVVAMNAVLVLIKFGLNDDAAIIIRTIFEIELQLGAIKEQPDLAAQLVQRAEAFRCGRLKAFINAITEGREMPEGITKEAMTERRDQIRAAIKNGLLEKKRTLSLRIPNRLFSTIRHRTRFSDGLGSLPAGR